MSKKPERKRGRAMRVAGLTIRTDNAAESRPDGKIPALWQRFRGEDWFARLEQLGAHGPPLGIYSAYESDVTGSFQLLAGREIDAATRVTAPLHVVSIPATSCLVFHSSGALPESVVRGWQEVWAYFEQPNAPARAYSYDVEIYPDAESVEIWVAIR